MIPYQLKLRTIPKKTNSVSIQSIEEKNSRKKTSSSHGQQKLTHGKHKYSEIKCSLSKNCDSHSKVSEVECTFEPRLSNQQRNSHTRSFQKFY